MECKENFKSEKDEILDHVWNLFNFLDDKDYEPFVNSVLYFINTHGFDIGVLPDGLRDLVEQRIKEDYWVM